MAPMVGSGHRHVQVPPAALALLPQYPESLSRKPQLDRHWQYGRHTTKATPTHAFAVWSQLAYQLAVPYRTPYSCDRGSQLANGGADWPSGQSLVD
jgi:hypothetical protein